MEKDETARIATETPHGPDSGPSCTTVAEGYGSCRDEALLLRTRAGEHAAFNALVERHQDCLYALALGSLGDAETAGDALCAAVVAAYRNLAAWSPDCRPCTWLWLHTLNEVLRRLDLAPGKYTLVSRPIE